MILFLDYDGTLHPSWAFQEKEGRTVARRYEGPWLVEAPTLERILQPYLSRTEIVISSLWAKTKGLKAATDMLSPALAGRVSDCIWPTGLGGDDRLATSTRYLSIRSWLDVRRPDYHGPWLALDDDDEQWPEWEREHLVHAAGTLANPRVQFDLVNKLARHFFRPEPNA